MPKFAANLSMLYPEIPFMERFKACAEDGFEGIEALFPYDVPAADIAQALHDNSLKAVLFNTPPGDWAAGDRGLAGQPGREAEFRAAVDQALQRALALGCKRIHVLSGVGPSLHERMDLLCANLVFAAAQFAPHGITALVEPINPRDIPGYLLNTQAQAFAVLQQVGAVNLKMQFDMYHCQIVEGEVATHLRQYLPHITHVQIAGVPDRQEPDRGELHYPYLLQLLDDLGYTGWVGCEYRPRAGTREGLGWLKAQYRPC